MVTQVGPRPFPFLPGLYLLPIGLLVNGAPGGTMDSVMKITFLGTSAAWPTPQPGCHCPQCSEARADGRLRRTRSSLLIESADEVVLVDPGPDVFHQFEREGLEPRVDRVLVTHSHADHVLGLGDLERLRADRKHVLRVHAAAYHRKRIGEIFPYLVDERDPRIVFEVWKPGTEISLEGIRIEGFETGHRARFPTAALLMHLHTPDGMRRVAYATDMGELPDDSRERLEEIDLFVGDGTFLGGEGHGHPGTDAVLALGAELDVEKVAFTHVGHVQVDDAGLRERLGEGVGLAYDGGNLLDLLP